MPQSRSLLFCTLNSLYVLKSYLNERQFETKFNRETSSRFHVHSGVPQGGIFCPLLYVLYTSDLPTSREPTLRTLPDDTAIFATNEDSTIASLKLQEHSHIIDKLLKKLNVKVNESKSSHMPLPCSQDQPNYHTSNRSTKIPRTSLQLQVKLERTHRQKKKTNRFKYKRDQLVDRKKIPYIYRK